MHIGVMVAPRDALNVSRMFHCEVALRSARTSRKIAGQMHTGEGRARWKSPQIV